MLHINFSNIEELVMENSEMYQVLPSSARTHIELWKIGKQFPPMRQIGRQALFDLINPLDDDAIEAMEEYFGERIMLEKLNYNVVENMVVPIDDAKRICDLLCEIKGFNYFSTWRDDKHLYISFWR